MALALVCGPECGVVGAMTVKFWDGMDDAFIYPGDGVDDTLVLPDWRPLNMHDQALVMRQNLKAIASVMLDDLFVEPAPPISKLDTVLEDDPDWLQHMIKFPDAPAGTIATAMVKRSEWSEWKLAIYQDGRWTAHDFTSITPKRRGLKKVEFVHLPWGGIYWKFRSPHLKARPGRRPRRGDYLWA